MPTRWGFAILGCEAFPKLHLPSCAMPFDYDFSGCSIAFMALSTTEWVLEWHYYPILALDWKNCNWIHFGIRGQVWLYATCLTFWMIWKGPKSIVSSCSWLLVTSTCRRAIWRSPNLPRYNSLSVLCLSTCMELHPGVLAGCALEGWGFLSWILGVHP